MNLCDNIVMKVSNFFSLRLYHLWWAVRKYTKPVSLPFANFQKVKITSKVPAEFLTVVYLFANRICATQIWYGFNYDLDRNR